MKNKPKDVIIEDIVCCDYKNGHYESIANFSYLYDVMTDLYDITKKECVKEGKTAYIYFSEIFVALLNLGLLGNPDYSLYYTPVNGGIKFAFNLSKAKRKMNLEAMLKKELDGWVPEQYIQSFLNPSDYCFCTNCGAVELTNRMHFFYEVKQSDCCSLCSELSKDFAKLVRIEAENHGTAAAIKLRRELIKIHNRVYIAAGKTIDGLIDEFIAYNRMEPNAYYEAVSKILEECGRKELQAFAMGKFGVCIINRIKAADIDVFSEIACMADDSGTELWDLKEKMGVCWYDDNALKYALTLTENQNRIEEVRRLLNG